MAERSNIPRIFVIGAGLVGQRHAKLVADYDGAELAGLIDPDSTRDGLAENLGCARFSSLEDISAEHGDAAIVATPNGDHLKTGLACAARDWPVLMEKPISDKMDDGQRLIDAFATKHLPLLVGHHRRYHPVFDETRALLEEEKLGRAVVASVIWAVRKPDDYFAAGAWRKGADGGPLLINFIHEADLLLGLFGPARSVMCRTSNAIRGDVVEDTAAIIIEFASGILATISVSDAALSPWSFEGATNENPFIANTGMASWRIGCTSGSIEFPKLRVWQDAEGGEGDWSKPLLVQEKVVAQVAPLQEQLVHFCDLITGRSIAPKVSGQDGLSALKLVDAILQSSKLQRPIDLMAQEKTNAA